ncbi:DUF1003 domain-containing protein [Flaviflexus massiliensis]|uniref:DUF1003 domain-containing protein n=1 Tax=Flaviflexus massiliensis TaxID=1522309 RepID=UPI0006D56003|nr:DUF1003 domain-containing protein [Flaviflexus massiliensis]
MADRFSEPLDARNRKIRKLRNRRDSDRIGQVSEAIARFTGTPQFLVYLSVFVALWLGWNTWGPEHLRFDSAALGFTALTLMLSLQASYSAPLILLAQNRQDNRDKVANEQDRQRAERNLADTEYLTREIAGLRMTLGDMATRDFVRSELRSMIEELDRERSDRLNEREARIAELQAEIERLRHDPSPTDQDREEHKE